MASLPAIAPVLSTPDAHTFEDPAPTVVSKSRPPDSELSFTYEIERTITEIKRNRWKRIALQFPDSFLTDAPRVYELLQNGLSTAPPLNYPAAESAAESLVQDTNPEDENEHLYILGDTSYGACCVDEVAAAHVDAQAVVHYGRACLSPTARLPVIHVFTIQPLALDPVITAFKSTYHDLSAKVILMADVTYASHLPTLASAFSAAGYTGLYTTSIIHDPESLLPNRTVPPSIEASLELLTSWALFHISDPPRALLLTLSSRVASIHIYPTHAAPAASLNPPISNIQPLLASTTQALRRRYALLTRISRAPIIGILINTLSVHAYLSALARIQALIAGAGKKSYVFVMGKLNAAKIANFAEVGGWVVVGCWESSLVESDEFEKPVVAPFELEVALQGDESRIWTGAWRGDFRGLLGSEEEGGDWKVKKGGESGSEKGIEGKLINGGDLDSESESEPPEFDLRSGRYISHSRPMRGTIASKSSKGQNAVDDSGGNSSAPAHSLIKRAKGDMARIGGEISPGAEFLREKKTWRGLGSDFEIAYEEDAEGEKRARIEEGRSGIARGYADEGSR